MPVFSSTLRVKHRLRVFQKSMLTEEKKWDTKEKKQDRQEDEEAVT
jgi:hypothetical protein